MKWHKQVSQCRRGKRGLLAGVLIALGGCLASAETSPMQALLERTSDHVSKFVEQFSDVKCTEQVLQEKLKKDGKVEYKEESTFDYLAILTNAGGELSLDESRLPVRVPKQDKNKPRSLLISNGFATLFLVFHPYYAGSFKFTDGGADTIDGRKLEKIQFQHIRDTRSPAALALRGREFALDLSGTAWVDPQTGIIEKIAAGVEKGLEDIGMKALHSEVTFAPVPFRDMKETYWFPVEANVEVETPRQHWRNVHHFNDYKKFSVNTEEKVAEK